MLLATIFTMYSTMMPIIMSGLFNMIFCKSSLMKSLQVPMDFDCNFVDGKRIFGSHKTWKGFFGYIVFNAFSSILWGSLCNLCNINQYNYFYINHENTILYNMLIGALLGFTYAIFELPNSFMKRRLNIVPGKTSNNWTKIIFVFIDQVDSIVGCALLIWLFYDIGMVIFVAYIIFGFVSHLFMNMFMFKLKLRRDIV